MRIYVNIESAETCIESLKPIEAGEDVAELPRIVLKTAKFGENDTNRTETVRGQHFTNRIWRKDMARATYAGKELIDAVRQCLPVFATDEGSKLMENLKTHAASTESGNLHEFWTAIGESVEKYRQTELTDSDLDKIDKHNDKIAEIEEEIAKINAKVLEQYSKRSTDAMKAGDFALFQQLGLEMKQTSEKRTVKQRKAIGIERKCILTLKNKQIDAGLAVFQEKLEIHDGSGSGTGGTSKHPFENERFFVKATRSTPINQEPLAYAANWYYDAATRRIWVELTGDGYNPEWRLETLEKPLFAGFVMQKDGKAAISTKSRLNNLNYMWINVATVVKPKSQEDLFEVINRCNLRLQNGNIDTEYSGGAAYALRLVEEFESDAADAGSQKLYSECPEIDWDNLEEHKALINALIDAETAGDDVESAEDVSETAETLEKAA